MALTAEKIAQLDEAFGFSQNNDISQLSKEEKFARLDEAFGIKPQKPQPRITEGFSGEAITGRIEQFREKNNSMTPGETYKAVKGVTDYIPEPLAVISPMIGAVKKGLPILSAAEKYVEAGIAEPATAIQQGKPVGEAIGKALSGQSKAELGDVYAGAGLSPKLASAAGLATSIVGVPSVVDIAGKGAKIASSIATETPEKLAKKISFKVKDYANSIGLSKMKGQNASKGLIRKYVDTEGAMKTIAENNKNISYVDEFGQSVGQKAIPQTQFEHAQAINQTKEGIFKQYNNIVKEATGRNISIDNAPVIRIIDDSLAENLEKVNIKKVAGLSGDDSKYLAELRNELSKTDASEPEVVQSIIKSLGNKYSDSITKKESKAMIEILGDVNKKYKELLDDAIVSGGGDSDKYKALKKKYSELLTLEKDVNNKMYSEARRTGEFGKNLDSFFVGDIIGGGLRVLGGDVVGGGAKIARGSSGIVFRKILNAVKRPDYKMKKAYKAVLKEQSKFPKIETVTPAQNVLGLPNLPKGAQRPQFEAGVEGGAVPMNMADDSVIQGLSPEMADRVRMAQQQRALPAGTPARPISERGSAPVNELAPQRILNAQGEDISAINMPQVLKSDLDNPNMKKASTWEGLKNVPESDRPLYEEALKYDSADEFVKKSVLNDLNPTGSIFANYTPEQRAKLQLGENITTLDKTLGGSYNDKIIIYRGGKGEGIVSGDFVTTNQQLAKDYAGQNKVHKLEVKKGDLLDDITEPLGEEYIYRTNAFQEKSQSKSQLTDIYNKAHSKTNNKSAMAVPAGYAVSSASIATALKSAKDYKERRKIQIENNLTDKQVRDYLKK